MDPTTLLGIAIGIGCILLGQMLEGGEVSSIVQGTAALIVMGGTLGAVIAQFSLDELISAFRQFGQAFGRRAPPLEPLIRWMVDLSRRSRREGLLSIEAEADKVDDPFLRQSLLALVDGLDSSQLRSQLYSSIEQWEQYQSPGPRFFEAAGGYAPTVGILGAVLGLIHVMQNLADPSKLGAGIAVAFVATVYGVGSANLLFLPLAGKMKTRIDHDARRKELIVEAVCAIQEGSNPQTLQKRLLCFLDGHPTELAAAGKKARPRRKRR